MHRQLSFDLPVRAALGREDFFVAPANAMAVALIEGWRDWPGRKLVLEGPKGAGKTHLAHVWAQAAGARIVKARALAGADIPDLASGPVAVEDVPLIAGDTAAENALFPTPDTIPYLVTRMDRSFDSARQLVAALDAAALAQGRPINRKLAADVMERFIQPGLLDNSPD